MSHKRGKSLVPPKRAQARRREAERPIKEERQQVPKRAGGRERLFEAGPTPGGVTKGGETLQRGGNYQLWKKLSTEEKS